MDLVLEQVEADIRHYGFKVGLASERRVLAVGSLAVDDRGNPIEYELDFPETRDMPEESGLTFAGRLLTQVPTAIVPLPQEAVGVGAEWTLTYEESRDGLAAVVTNRHRLVGFHGETAVIQVRSSSVVDVTGTALERASMSGEQHVTFSPTTVLSASELSMIVEMSAKDSSKPRLRVTRTVATRPIEDEWFGVLPELHRSTDSMQRPAWCKSLRGNREGPFPAEGGPSRLTGTCSDGQPTGHWIAYHEDRQTKRLEGDFDAGMPVGRWTQYDAAGREVGSFELDGGTGTATVWWPTRQKRSEVGVLRGEAHGTVETWHANGAPLLRGGFVGGKRDGAWEEFDEAGVRTATGTYDSGCRLLYLRPESPAAEAGLQSDDIVVEVGETAVADQAAILEALATREDGPVRVVVQRDGKKRVFTPTLSDGRLGVRLSCGSRFKQYE